MNWIPTLAKKHLPPACSKTTMATESRVFYFWKKNFKSAETCEKQEHKNRWYQTVQKNLAWSGIEIKILTVWMCSL
jgi:hypothetical protein